MRIGLFTLLILVATSCIMHRDSLNIYTEDFNPNCDCVSTNGYYVAKAKDLSDNWGYQAMVFYKNGEFYMSPMFYNINDFEIKLSNYPNSFHRAWGFYQCVDDTLFMEYLYTVPRATYRIDLLGVVADSTIKLLNDGYSDPLSFIEHKNKPDSTQNWIKTHRKYRIH